VVISAAALLLSLLALVAARWADAGRRSADWRALREGGVSPRRLRRLVRIEIALPAALGVLVGLLSGAIAARIAGSRLPLVDADAPGPPLDLQLAWWPIVLLGSGAVLVIALIAQIGALAEVRRGEGQ
jgi:putative ABC transport system permease protein